MFVPHRGDAQPGPEPMHSLYDSMQYMGYGGMVGGLYNTEGPMQGPGPHGPPLEKVLRGPMIGYITPHIFESVGLLDSAVEAGLVIPAPLCFEQVARLQSTARAPVAVSLPHPADGVLPTRPAPAQRAAHAASSTAPVRGHPHFLSQPSSSSDSDADVPHMGDDAATSLAQRVGRQPGAAGQPRWPSSKPSAALFAPPSAAAVPSVVALSVAPPSRSPTDFESLAHPSDANVPPAASCAMGAFAGAALADVLREADAASAKAQRRKDRLMRAFQPALAASAPADHDGRPEGADRYTALPVDVAHVVQHEQSAHHFHHPSHFHRHALRNGPSRPSGPNAAGPVPLMQQQQMPLHSLLSDSNGSVALRAMARRPLRSAMRASEGPMASRPQGVRMMGALQQLVDSSQPQSAAAISSAAHRPPSRWGGVLGDPAEGIDASLHPTPPATPGAHGMVSNNGPPGGVSRSVLMASPLTRGLDGRASSSASTSSKRADATERVRVAMAAAAKAGKMRQ